MSYWVVYKGPKQDRVLMSYHGFWVSQQKIGFAKRFSREEADQFVAKMKGANPFHLYGVAEIKDPPSEAE